MIEPAQVRLSPRPDDPYAWRVLPAKRALFARNLSDHSVGAYRELWAAVGESFEAVPSQTWHIQGEESGEGMVQVHVRA